MKSSVMQIVGAIGTLLAVLFLGFWLGMSYSEKTVPPGYDQSFQHQKDSLEFVLEQKSKEITALRIAEDSLKARATSFEQKFYQIQKKYEKESTAVHTYTPTKLQQFFSDRYPE